MRLELDLQSKNISPNRVSFYLQWKQTLNTDINTNTNATIKLSATKSSANIDKQNVDKSKISGKVVSPDKSNPLYTFLFDKANISGNSSSAIVLQKCMSCNCSGCLESMVTHIIYNSETNTQLTDKENYYCTVCRVKNPKFYVNQTKKRDKNIYAFSLIEEYFEDTIELIDHLEVDYYS
jgi:hypothetical protein